MPSEQLLAEPTTLTFDPPVDALKVRLVSGNVNVVGSPDPGARLEVTALEGPPLRVALADGTLTVAYEDLPWQGFLKWLDRKGWKRHAVVSLVVPAGTRVELGVVDATAVVSGIAAPIAVQGVSGDTTVVGISGPVRADTVSGRLEAQAVSGELRFNSVSGELTVVDGGSPRVRADSVSGDMVVDLVPAARSAEVTLTSVSGDAALRLPEAADLEVEAHTASGAVSCAFESLRIAGQWGAKRVSGRIGQGKGRVRMNTVSGAVALLRRPPQDGPEPTVPGHEKVL
ncbi:hypothetical protein SRB5_38050 [Streptomyces sp. RB5]|uniref:DUF4097 domain-containing protein n=1 Tax=Streptomyces smaragdinus TaxID=2585196 RepID=A0A7K0CJJ4_9ACTN|nr:DUF4097 family beta strand repeat-containing protein [Streptomyces smaragdinus]MQY13655.1 hypothetical protein [Streptomyces smaragdinus]